MIKKFFFALWIVLLLALLVFLLLMGSENDIGETAAPAETLAPVGLLSSPDLSALSRHLGVSVPYFSENGVGKVEDAAYPGGYARLLVWTDETGCTISCVRPSAAASLLRDDALSPNADVLYTIEGMTAFFCTGDAVCALYFGSDDAAYSISAPISREEMLSQLPHLQFTQ